MAKSNKCPLCDNRKAKRWCPAKATEICSVCCGTKREVEIDCPADCVYLHAGREYESERLNRTQTPQPLTRRLWEDHFLARHYGVLQGMWRIIVAEREASPELVDSDVAAVVEALIQSYRTLEKGIYYDSLPDSFLQRDLFLKLKEFLDPPRPSDAATPPLKTSAILDCLQFQKEFISTSTLPKPRSRGFLDNLRKEVARSQAEPETERRIILP
ncbi:MAG: hypothetical protein AB1898_01785 [Acidobacteriota bacterium]